MNTALVLIDIQNEYFKGGNIELYKVEEAAANARIALNFFRDRKLPVFFVQHINTKPTSKSFLPNTEGSKIYVGVSPLDNEEIIVKHEPSSFFETGLDEKLKKQKIQHLVVCGMMSHMCIDTTLRVASDLGYTATLLHDACTTKNLIWDNKIIDAATVHSVFMASLNGKFSRAITTKQFVSEQI